MIELIGNFQLIDSMLNCRNINRACKIIQCSGHRFSKAFFNDTFNLHNIFLVFRCEMLKLILGRAGTGKSTAILNTMAAESKNRPQVLIVPEQPKAG